MKCVFTNRAYQWPGGVGVAVLTEHGDVITYENGGQIACAQDELILIAHSHTRELEFVRYGDLQPSPSSPIPEPMK